MHIPRGGLGVGKSDAGIGNDTRGEAWSHCGTCWGGRDEIYMLLRGDGVALEMALSFPFWCWLHREFVKKTRIFYSQTDCKGVRGGSPPGPDRKQM